MKRAYHGSSSAELSSKTAKQSSTTVKRSSTMKGSSATMKQSSTRKWSSSRKQQSNSQGGHSITVVPQSEENDMDNEIYAPADQLFPIIPDRKLYPTSISALPEAEFVETLLHDLTTNTDSDNELDLDNESENDDEIAPEFTWKIGQACDFTMPSFQESPLFVHNHERFTHGSAPINFFKLFFDDEVLHLMVTETNRYAHSFYSNRQDVNQLTKGARQFTACSKLDMKKFLVILLIMGRTPQPSMDCYWNQNEWFSSNLISSLMPLVRFQQILRFLHFVDNNQAPDKTNPAYDRLWKIRPLVDMMRTRFRQEAVLSQALSFDEIMVPYKGRLNIKQYMKDKPTRWGVKLYAIGSVNGYLADFEPYMGKSSVGDPHFVGDEFKGMGESSLAIVRLAQPYLNQGHIIHADNFYSSIYLVKWLLANGTGYNGTIRANRKGFPNSELEIKSSEARGTIKYATISDNTFAVLAWKDVRVVNMISSVYNPSKVIPISRKTRSTVTGTQQIQKPIMIHHYNQNMGGIDITDQCRSYLSDISNRSRRGYQCIFYFCLQQSVVNARRLYLNYHMGQNMSVSKFLEKLITAMTEEIHNEIATATLSPAPVEPITSKSKKQNLPGETLKRLQPGNHFPKKQVSYEN